MPSDRLFVVRKGFSDFIFATFMILLFFCLLLAFDLHRGVFFERFTSGIFDLITR